MNHGRRASRRPSAPLGIFQRRLGAFLRQVGRRFLLERDAPLPGQQTSRDLIHQRLGTPLGTSRPHRRRVAMPDSAVRHRIRVPDR